MFKKFAREDVSTSNQVKASIQRSIRAKILELYPLLGETHAIDVIIPKKESAIVAKCPDKTQLLVLNNTPLFFSNRDGQWFPTLRLLHQYPEMMKKARVDQGAIKFVLSGANIMCPGLTSPGATLHDEVQNAPLNHPDKCKFKDVRHNFKIEADHPVAIYAEGKEHATAIGLTKMSTSDIRTINKGIGVDTLHFLNDGLWKTTSF